ncbi:hypothetical protein [Sphingomonas sp.]|uniref:hypothetical protein n=1 Tax=Sphingomonas sp. TaxID=28214 RepID=UPI003B00CB3C
MKHWHIAIMACALPLAACDRPAEERVTIQARDAVTRRLIDPGSARFRDVYIVQDAPRTPADDGDRHVVCGQVDAKNRAGVRIGFRRYSWSDRGGAPWIEGQGGGARDPWCTT